MSENNYRPGSIEDFDRLYRAVYPRLKRTLLSIVEDQEAAEDCAQEAFLQAFRAWASWNPTAPAEAWIHRIGVNVAISHRRRQRLRQVGELLRRLGRPVPGPDPAEVGGWRDLREALRRLPPKLSAAIVLRHYHGYSNREIAASLAISERTVGLWISDAKERLRRQLGEAWAGEIPIWADSDVPSVREVNEGHG